MEAQLRAILWGIIRVVFLLGSYVIGLIAEETIYVFCGLILYTWDILNHEEMVTILHDLQWGLIIYLRTYDTKTLSLHPALLCPDPCTC